jgi:hypothetical protein
MKGLAGVAALMLVFAIGLATTASASDRIGQAAAAKAKKRKCKKGLVRRKGKCRHPVRTGWADTSPRHAVRATVSWQGDANVDLIVLDTEDRRAGYSAAAGGVVNEIPDATHQGDVTGGGTETFVDHIWYPNPSLARSRGFIFEVCARQVAEPVTATLTFLRASGGQQSIPVHYEPPSEETGATNLCLGYYG